MNGPAFEAALRDKMERRVRPALRHGPDGPELVEVPIDPPDPPPPSDANPMVRALQVLKRLRRDPGYAAPLLEGLGDLDEMIAYLYEECRGYDWLIPCHGCGCHHRPDYTGSCLVLDERFP